MLCMNLGTEISHLAPANQDQLDLKEQNKKEDIRNPLTAYTQSQMIHGVIFSSKHW